MNLCCNATNKPAPSLHELLWVLLQFVLVRNNAAGGQILNLRLTIVLPEGS